MIEKLEKENFDYIDNLKAISLIAVILMHVLVIFIDFQNLESKHWWIGNILDSSIRFCVPIFLMVSGALLLGKDWEFKIFLKKRFLRLIWPFFFWTVIYLIFNYHFGEFSNLNLYEWIVNNILKGVSFHFWYIYLIISVYLILPIFNKWIVYSKKYEVKFLLGSWICMLILATFFKNKLIQGSELITFFGYLGYTILGFYLHRYSKNNYVLGGILFLFGVIITASATCYSSLLNNSFNNIYYAYLSPNVILAAIGIFIFFKNFKFNTNVLSKPISFLSRHSLGIYLGHILFLRLLLKFR